MRSRVVPFACAVVVLAVSLAACGEDRKGSVEQSGGSTATTGADTTETTTTPTPSGAVVAKVKVKETEYVLDPKNPRVAKAGVVSFEVKNAGKITHALEVEGPGGEAKTEGIRPGASATLKADLSKPGTYEWYCPIDGHKGLGMKGGITVAGGGSGASGGKRSDDSAKGSGGSGKRGGAGGGDGVY